MSRATSATKLAALALLLCAACGVDREGLYNPDGGTGGSYDPPDADPPDDDPPMVKRTVITRNPFGNVSETQNLLWDGDFEWSSPFSDQYGWRTLSSFSTPDLRVGAECRSGVKCARLEPGEEMVGIAVGTTAMGIEASVYARPESGGCEGLEVSLIGDDLLGSDPSFMLTPEEERGEDGWCRYAGTSGPRKHQVFMLILNESEVRFFIDQAVMKRVAVGVTGEASAPSKPKPAPAELLPRIAEVAAKLRDLRQPNDPPPNAARRAYDAWVQSQAGRGGNR